MEIIDIKDYFKISDDHSEVRGFLVVEENGKTIFMKENMVTSNGRKFIKDTCFQAFFSDDRELSTTKFDSINFGSDGSITTTNMTELKTSIDKLVVFKITSGNDPVTEDGITYKLKSFSETSNIKLELSISAITSSPHVVREAGLFLSDGTMFSRVAFAPLTLKTGTTYTINYYIYF